MIKYRIEEENNKNKIYIEIQKARQKDYNYKSKNS